MRGFWRRVRPAGDYTKLIAPSHDTVLNDTTLIYDMLHAPIRTENDKWWHKDTALLDITLARADGAVLGLALHTDAKRRHSDIEAFLQRPSLARHSAFCHGHPLSNTVYRFIPYFD